MGEYDGEKLLRRLALVSNWTRLPGKRDVSQYLQPYRQNKALCAWKKMELYFWALLCPKRFSSSGVMRTSDRYPGLETIAVIDANILKNTDSLVFLGGSSAISGVTEFGVKHQAQGGSVVQMMHDLIPLLLPQYCTPSMAIDFRQWLQATRQYVTHFVCVSQNTARDLRATNLLNNCRAAITVLPLAHEFEGRPRNAVVDKGLLPQGLRSLPNGFVLCVGTIEPRKNGVALLECWRNLHRELRDRMPILVFAGKRGWHNEEFDRLLNGSEIKEIATVIDAPSDAVLSALYHHCLFTVFPSFYEGWGLPIGESAWFGKHCVASSAASMPEVCGALMDYIDPSDTASLGKTLQRAIVDTNHRWQCEQRIKVAKLRTWNEVANDLLSHIEQCCNPLDTIIQ